jgi:hypothetical protein
MLVFGSLISRVNDGGSQLGLEHTPFLSLSLGASACSSLCHLWNSAAKFDRHRRVGAGPRGCTLLTPAPLSVFLLITGRKQSQCQLAQNFLIV